MRGTHQHAVDPFAHLNKPENEHWIAVDNLTEGYRNSLQYFLDLGYEPVKGIAKSKLLFSNHTLMFLPMEEYDARMAYHVERAISEGRAMVVLPDLRDTGARNPTFDRKEGEPITMRSKGEDDISSALPDEKDLKRPAGIAEA